MIDYIEALAIKLLGQEAAFESKFVWSVGNQALINVSMPCVCNHESGPGFVWMLQTALRELQDYVMSLIQRFQRSGSAEK